MTKNSQDELARAYAMLSSLRQNIAQMKVNVSETYVREFHTVLDRLEAIGIDVSEFHVPDSAVQPRLIPVSYPEGGAGYSREKYVEKSFILTKLDAILGYFEITASKKPRKIGFRKPDEG